MLNHLLNKLVFQKYNQRHQPLHLYKKKKTAGVHLGVLLISKIVLCSFVLKGMKADRPAPGDTE